MSPVGVCLMIYRVLTNYYFVAAEFHHKVALAVCLVLFCVATIVFVVIARRYCCIR